MRGHALVTGPQLRAVVRHNIECLIALLLLKRSCNNMIQRHQCLRNSLNNINIHIKDIKQIK